MKEIKLTIDGKEIQLTDEQLKMLGVKVKKNPFDRVSSDGKYYYTIANGIFGGDVSRCVDRNDIFANSRFTAHIFHIKHLFKLCFLS